MPKVNGKDEYKGYSISIEDVALETSSLCFNVRKR
jgi:hypothetical protein